MINDGKRIVIRRSDRKAFRVVEEGDERVRLEDKDGAVKSMSEERFRKHFATRFGVVAIDETANWLDEDLVKRCGGKIYTLYVYNPDEATYLCELTPSYDLEPLDYYPAELPEDENEREKIYEKLQETLLHEEVSYMHCHSIDGVKTQIIEDFHVDCRLDDAREYWQGNSPCIPGI